jgi:hypothetical protein
MPDGIATAPGGGALAIALACNMAGAVRAVAIASGALRGARAFRGRPADAVPTLAGSLFALCGQAQSVAATAALAAARGRPGPLAAAVARPLAAERIAGLLRAGVLDWPNGGAGMAAPLPLLPLRQALMEAARLQRGAGDVAALAAGMAALDPWFDHQAREAEAAPRFTDAATDPLRPDDDAAVIAALRADPEGFPRGPVLPGRRIETGAAMRHAAPFANAIARRLAARRADLAAALALLRGAAPAPGLLASGSPGPGEGWAAVETARGRLHHWACLDAEGRVAGYAILAPTDWNFAPDGPFAATLRGSALGAAAKAWAGRLAAAFDPCLPLRITLQGAADA